MSAVSVVVRALPVLVRDKGAARNRPLVSAHVQIVPSQAIHLFIDDEIRESILHLGHLAMDSSRRDVESFGVHYAGTTGPDFASTRSNPSSARRSLSKRLK